jgi:Ca2+-binding RTX toxin-like protein
MKIIDTVMIGSSGLDLDNDDDNVVYVGRDGFLGGETFYGIYAIQSGTNLNIDGSVVGYAAPISLDDPAGDPDSAKIVTIGETGYVYGISNGMVIAGAGNLVVNHGLIRSDRNSTVGMFASGSNIVSSVINDGTITAGYGGAGVYYSGGGDGKLTNTGTISGPAASFSSSNSSGDMVVLNKGTMIGAVIFGGGGDVYNGHSGRVSGVVFGGEGNDRLIGGARADRLEGDKGRDALAGGAAADHFIFAALKDSTVAKSGRDLITDFHRSQHDVVDLSLIDAKDATGANDKFKFIGDHAFTGHEGELRFTRSGNNTMVQMDSDGDKHADSAIELTGKIALHASDFVL